MKRLFQLLLSLTLVCTLTAYLLMGRGQVQLVQTQSAMSPAEFAANPSLVAQYAERLEMNYDARLGPSSTQVDRAYAAYSASTGGAAAHPSLVGLQGSVSGVGERIERFRAAWHRVYALFTPKPKKRPGVFRAQPAAIANGVNVRGSIGIGLTFIFIAVAVAGLSGAISWLERRSRA